MWSFSALGEMKFFQGIFVGIFFPFLMGVHCEVFELANVVKVILQILNKPMRVTAMVCWDNGECFSRD